METICGNSTPTLNFKFKGHILDETFPEPQGRSYHYPSVLSKHAVHSHKVSLWWHRFADICFSPLTVISVTDGITEPSWRLWHGAPSLTATRCSAAWKGLDWINWDAWSREMDMPKRRKKTERNGEWPWWLQPSPPAAGGLSPRAGCREAGVPASPSYLLSLIFLRNCSVLISRQNVQTFLTESPSSPGFQNSSWLFLADSTAI